MNVFVSAVNDSCIVILKTDARFPLRRHQWSDCVTPARVLPALIPGGLGCSGGRLLVKREQLKPVATIQSSKPRGQIGGRTAFPARWPLLRSPGPGKAWWAGPRGLHGPVSQGVSSLPDVWGV